MDGLHVSRRSERRACRRLSFLLALGSLLSGLTTATTYVPISDRELLSRADVVVRGVVMSNAVAEDSNGRPQTVTVITPLEVLKGEVSGSLVLRELGGDLPDGRFFKLWGRPEYQPGREVVVFALARPGGDYQTAELLLGKFEIQEDDTGRLFAVPSLAEGATPGVTVAQRAKDGPSDKDPSLADPAAPRDLESFLRLLRRPAAATPTATAAPQGQLRAVVHQEYTSRALKPEWVTNGLWRWNNGASAVFTLDGLANVTGGGVAEATNATATWSAEPNSTIGYSVGSGSGSVIHMDALTSPCGWTSCLTGSGVIGCGGVGGAGTNSWRGETYVTITSGEVWLRSYCSLNAFDSTTTQSVLTHELGHTLGLGHSDQGASPHDVCIGDENLAIMRSVVQYRTTLGTDDSDAVRWLYGDGGNSCNTTTPPPPPTVTTNAASGVGQTGATLKGTVNPNGTDTNVSFEYGTTTAYGNTTAPQAIGAGTSAVAVSQAVSNLACGMPYHLRVVATTAFATTRGLDQTFTTTACSPTKFYTVTPCRIADTRNAAGPSGGPALAAGDVRSFPAAGLCGVPTSARAIAANLAVYLPGNAGDLRGYPAGGAAPMASSLNFRPGIVRSNSAVVPLGSGGQVAIQCDMPSGGTNVFIDVFGYFQ